MKNMDDNIDEILPMMYPILCAVMYSSSGHIYPRNIDMCAVYVNLRDVKIKNMFIQEIFL